MNRVFLDTGDLIASEASDDQHFEQQGTRRSLPDVKRDTSTSFNRAA
jgi:hypothetical protein